MWTESRKYLLQINLLLLFLSLDVLGLLQATELLQCLVQDLLHI